MRFRHLTPRARSRFLASGLFLIGLSTAASLLSPALSPGVSAPGLDGQSPAVSSGEDVERTTLPLHARTSLAVEVAPAAGRTEDCPSTG